MKHALSPQQLGRGPLRPTPPDGPTPSGPDDGTSRPIRSVGPPGGLGCAAAGYAVFQFLFEVLPASVGGEAVKYLIASARSRSCRHAGREMLRPRPKCARGAWDAPVPVGASQGLHPLLTLPSGTRCSRTSSSRTRAANRVAPYSDVWVLSRFSWER